jgi:hypothetical protein
MFLKRPDDNIVTKVKLYCRALWIEGLMSVYDDNLGLDCYNFNN